MKNQQWKYSAPRPSRGYWESDDVNYEDEVEAFLEQIKKYTEEMRYGTSNEDVYFIDAEVSYDENFLPHWKEFANAIEQYQYCVKCLPKDTETKLALFDVELSDEVLELLSKALESTHFDCLGLKNNNLGQAGIDFALNYLKSNQIMNKFFLYDNTIDNIKDVKQLCQIVEDHPSIERLTLAGCCGEEVDGYETLQMIINAGKSKLKLFDLSNNNINTGGDTFISDFLKDNPTLSNFWFSGNQLDNNDAIAIAGALKCNTNLVTLDLTDNNISKDGWSALRKAEFDDTSLNSAADSNHTCAIKYPSGGDEIQGLDTSEMNGDPDSSVVFDPMYIRQKKIYSVLSSRNRECSNVGHFDDVPVELLPDMLDPIQQYSKYHIGKDTPGQASRDVNPLSLVYEIYMPTLGQVTSCV